MREKKIMLSAQGSRETQRFSGPEPLHGGDAGLREAREEARRCLGDEGRGGCARATESARAGLLGTGAARILHWSPQQR